MNNTNIVVVDDNTQAALEAHAIVQEGREKAAQTEAQAVEAREKVVLGGVFGWVGAHNY